MRLYYTADVDRDVNVKVPGRVAAGSLDRGSGDSPRFSSSERGLGAVLDVLDSLGIKGTLFFEGRTAGAIDCSRAAGHRLGMHGYDHEDLTALDDATLEAALRSSFEAVCDAVGRPTCSRAPYMSADGRVLERTAEVTGIRVDSSFYTDVGGPAHPYAVGRTEEFPVTRSRDSAGRVIAAYLWPMHEGRRGPRDYIEMAAGIEGDIVIADHSWHMIETREGGVMSPEEGRLCAEQVRTVLEGIMDLGFEPSVLPRSPRPPARLFAHV